MYTNAVVNSVRLQLYLQHDFYKIIFKIQNKLYSSFRVSNPPPPTKEKFMVRTCQWLTGAAAMG